MKSVCSNPNSAKFCHNLLLCTQLSSHDPHPASPLPIPGHWGCPGCTFWSSIKKQRGSRQVFHPAKIFGESCSLTDCKLAVWDDIPNSVCNNWSSICPLAGRNGERKPFCKCYASGMSLHLPSANSTDVKAKLILRKNVSWITRQVEKNWTCLYSLHDTDTLSPET